MKPKPITDKNIKQAIVTALPESAVAVYMSVSGQSRHSSIHPTVSINVHPRRPGQDQQAIADAVAAHVRSGAKRIALDNTPFDYSITVHGDNRPLSVSLSFR